MSRWFFIDDDHPDIQYSGDWEVDRSPQADLNHQVFGGSQHRADGQATLIYSFQGHFIEVQGTNRYRNSTFGGPNWQCLVDGQVYHPLPLAQRVQNRFTYCQISGLDPNTTHTFIMVVQASRRTPMWVDEIGVIPSTSSTYHSSLSNYSAWIRSNDPTIRYSPGWVNLSTSGETQYTSVPGSLLNIRFFGSQVTWWALPVFGVEEPSTRSRATYSLDGGTQVDVVLSTPETNLGRYIVFESQKLPLGNHDLKVVYEGPGPSATSLVLQFLLIRDGDLLIREPPEINPDSSSNGQSPVGAIVGGVVGGLVLLLLVGLAGYFYGRRKENGRRPRPSSTPSGIACAAVIANPGASPTSAGIAFETTQPGHPEDRNWINAHSFMSTAGPNSPQFLSATSTSGSSKVVLSTHPESQLQQPIQTFSQNQGAHHHSNSDHSPPPYNPY
ncbi:hypothetical protein FA15DRAFT_759515 [Coprinopsis marcescibilis]|uniref:Transmembrane protein n=1 Tax=Coprinopsis marcescibilis TaxID=230819 RepID=A0A5C3KIY8_COPMA|nr:hypothetical protein FA15DRAFT_759515 [Coprinopsis marcescibilis]